jgi:sporulation protein YlmC with PRC-barrel domain
MAKPDKRRLSHRPTAAATLRQQIAVRRAIADQVVSLANLLRCPVLNDAGTRIGKVSDIVVRWDAGVSHPPVVGILIGVGSGFALLDRRDVELTQAEVRLRSGRQMVSRPVRRRGTSPWPATSSITSSSTSPACRSSGQPMSICSTDPMVGSWRSRRQALTRKSFCPLLAPFAIGPRVPDQTTGSNRELRSAAFETQSRSPTRRLHQRVTLCAAGY